VGAGEFLHMLKNLDHSNKNLFFNTMISQNESVNTNWLDNNLGTIDILTEVFNVIKSDIVIDNIDGFNNFKSILMKKQNEYNKIKDFTGVDNIVKIFNGIYLNNFLELKSESKEKKIKI